MKRSIKIKIAAPILAMAGIVILTFGLTYYYLNTNVRHIEQDRESFHHMNALTDSLTIAIQSGILTQDSSYAIGAARHSLAIYDLLEGLEASYPDEIAQYGEMFQDYFATVVSINSLFEENRVEEGSQRLEEL